MSVIYFGVLTLGHMDILFSFSPMFFELIDINLNLDLNLDLELNLI